VVSTQVLAHRSELEVLLWQLLKDAKLSQVAQQAVEMLCAAAGVCCQLADWYSRVGHARSIHHAQLDSSTQSCNRTGIRFALCMCDTLQVIVAAV
jgi:uncharacterized cysteine cluster protein YcgN (CxxCxxCC family)